MMMNTKPSFPIADAYPRIRSMTTQRHHLKQRMHDKYDQAHRL
jgi:hypothetical protein